MPSFEELNDKQKEAAKHIEGPLMIFAGPGTGKTTTVVHRYQKMLEAGIDPENILLTTFSNDAAQEMKERIAGLDEQRAEIGTLHSRFFNVVREHPERFGFDDDIEVWQFGEQLRHYERIIHEHEEFDVTDLPEGDEREEILDQTARFFKMNVDKARKDGLDEDTLDEHEFTDGGTDLNQEQIMDGVKDVFRDVFVQYRGMMRTEDGVDFVEMQYAPYREFQKDDEFRHEYTNKFEYITVDEAQDMAPIQYELVDLLSEENLCLVADDSQAIYGFRGGDHRLLRRFEKEYDADRIVIDTNYRSSQQIVESVNEINEQLEDGVVTKELDSEMGHSDMSEGHPEICHFENAKNEQEGMARIVERAAQNYPEDEIAVLCRTKRKMEYYRNAIMNRGVKAHVDRGKDFLKTNAADAFLSYFDAKADLDNDDAVADVLLDGSRIGSHLIDSLEEAKDEDETLHHFIQQNNVEEVKGIGRMKAGRIYDQMRKLEKMGKKDRPCEYIAKVMGEELEDEQVAVMMNVFEQFDDDEQGFREFVDFVRDSTIGYSDQTKEGVKITTLHGAKGKEWSVVVIPRCVEGNLPHSLSTDEEEKRLFYVGVSRAKEQCYLLQSMEDYRGNPNTPSPFLKWVVDQ